MILTDFQLFNLQDFPVVDFAVIYNSNAPVISIKKAMEEYKRNYSYIEENHKDFPCFDIVALQGRNVFLLNVIAFTLNKI